MRRQAPQSLNFSISDPLIPRVYQRKRNFGNRRFSNTFYRASNCPIRVEICSNIAPNGQDTKSAQAQQTVKIKRLRAKTPKIISQGLDFFLPVSTAIIPPMKDIGKAVMQSNGQKIETIPQITGRSTNAAIMPIMIQVFLSISSPFWTQVYFECAGS